MRTIRRGNRFKRDFRRVKRGIYRGVLDADLNELLVLLRSDAPIPPNYSDHPLTGSGAVIVNAISTATWY